jgi:hypothetical protein
MNEITTLHPFKRALSIDISTWYKGILSTQLASGESSVLCGGLLQDGNVRLALKLGPAFRQGLVPGCRSAPSASATRSLRIFQSGFVSHSAK